MSPEAKKSLSILSMLLGTVSTAACLTQDAVAQSNAKSDTAIETVIVTATKRDTPLQKTPVAITALDSKSLTEMHVVNVQDIVHLVPSFQATSEGDHGVITLTLRGIGNDTAKTEYADPEVAMFVDGVYSPRAEGATAMLFDMDSIEVLRGPQGTLWGRNSTTGVVNMSTAKPSLDKEFGSLTVGGGSFNQISARAAYNIPFSDTFAVRVAIAHEQHDGYVDYQNPDKLLPTVTQQQTAYSAAHSGSLTGFRPIDANGFVASGQKYSAQDQSALRISALWAPADNFSWNLSGEVFIDRGTLNLSLMQKHRAGESFWSALVDTAPYLHRDVYSIRSRMDYNINDYLSLSYIAGASRFSGSSTYDQDAGATIPQYFNDGNTSHQENRTNWSHYTSWSNELQLKSSGDHTVDWIVGLYYGAEKNGMQFDIPLMNGTEDSGSVGWQGTYHQPDETVMTQAVFGQATWNVTDALHLTGGLRYTSDHRANHGGVGYSWAYNAACNNVTAIPNGYDAAKDLYNATTNPTGCWSVSTYNSGQYKGDKVTWLGRAQYDVNSNFIVYASAATGFKAGGVQDGGETYDPERLTSFEIGTKNILFDGSVTWNNSAFYYAFKGYQIQQAVTLSNGNHTMEYWNAKGVTINKGFESELAAKLTKDDMLQISVSLLTSKLGTVETAGSNDLQNLPTTVTLNNGHTYACNVATGTDPEHGVADGSLSRCKNITGNVLPHAPAFSTQIGYSHDFHLANGAILQPRVNFHFETESWLSFFHDNVNNGHQDQQKAYTRTDIALRYTPANSKWYFEGSVRNIEDGRIRTSSGSTSTGIYNSQYLAPRTFGVNLGVDF